MVESFLSLNYGQSEQIIARSRFLGFSYYIDSEDDAIKILAELKSKYSDATHICYAYIADETANTIRFSDDGEPSATAGAPILEAIKSHKLVKTLVAVVRYFGGTKLGTGGLVRAYSTTAISAIESAKITKYTLCDILKINCDFITFSKIQSANTLKILDSTFDSAVTVTVAVKKSQDYRQYIDTLSFGKATIQIISTKYVEIDSKSFD